MQVTDILAQMGGLKTMAQELGIDESQAASGVSALLPAILGGFKKQAQAQPEGLGGLGSLLGSLGGGDLLDQVLSPKPTDVGQGNAILGQIFGSEDVNQAVAQNAAQQSGLDASLLQKMLPMVAMAVTGLMAKPQGTDGESTPASGAGMGDSLGGLLGGMLGGLFGQQGGGTAAQTPGGLLAMLDMNGDGNALDDILQMAKKAVG